LLLPKGHAGSGKTVLLKRLAWEAASIYDKLCLFVKPSAYPEYEPLIELYRLCNERIFLFFDPASEYVDVIERFLINAHKDKLPLTIVCGERNNEWNVYCADRLEPHLTETYQVRYLNEKEIESLIHLLAKHKSLGHLEGMSLQEQKDELAKRAGRQLLVALHEATLGKPFEEIVLDEYRSITSRQAQALYLTVCILHRLGVETRAGLISRVHGIPFHLFKDELFKPLEFVVFATMNALIKDYVYRSRHAQIAEIVFERALSNPQDRYDEYVRLLNTLDIDYSSDREAFRGLTNAKQLLSLFPNLHMIRQIYEIARNRVPDDASVVQQEAIFEMTSPDKNFDKAAALLHIAQKKEPHNKAIAHSLSVLAIRKSETAQTPLEKKKLRNEAKGIAIGLTSSGWVSEHPYHTLIKIGLDELGELIAEGDDTIIEKQIKMIEDTISKSIQLFPENDFLLESEAEFCNMISKSCQALSALKKAFSVNKRNPFIASRLSRMYETEGDRDMAIKILEECVEANPSDKYVNFQLARLLYLDTGANKIKIRHHLRKSFTEGDTNYAAQFWYARFLYLDGNIEDALDIFKRLSEAKIDGRIKRKARGKVTDETGIIRYTGTVQRLETSYAFIRRDGLNDRVFAHHENSSTEQWRELRPQYRVSFKMAFNYRGAIALDVKIENTPIAS
jgi:tetratricopeptide (TPR) repeat protein